MSRGLSGVVRGRTVGFGLCGVEAPRRSALSCVCYIVSVRYRSRNLPELSGHARRVASRRVSLFPFPFTSTIIMMSSQSSVTESDPEMDYQNWGMTQPENSNLDEMDSRSMSTLATEDSYDAKDVLSAIRTIRSFAQRGSIDFEVCTIA